MAMDFEKVEQRLHAMTCPVCKSCNDFTVSRDSRITDGEYKIFCKGCRYSMPVHMDMENYLRNQPDVPYWLKGMRCPACLKMGVTLDFWVQPSVRNALYFVSCNACQEPFMEKSSLEAYE
jgi:formylmethanofuran dehydrogenase subunit E